MANDNDMRKVVKGTGVDQESSDAIQLSERDQEYLAIRKRRRLLIIVVVLLLALLAGLAFALFSLVKPTNVAYVPGKTGAMEWVQSIYGTGKKELYAPTSVAVGPSGDIYVAEPQKSRILIFNADGGFDREIKSSKEETGTATEPSSTATTESQKKGGSKLPPMERPESVYVDGRGTLYIADSLKGDVFILDSDDELVRTIKVGESARGVAVSDTEIFVLGEGRVYVYGKGGGSDPLRWFGGFGNYPGEINAYQGIEVSGGTVYIADSANHRVEAFRTSGEFLWANPQGVASTEATTTIWGLPQDLTLDSADHLVIVDALRFEVSQASAKDGAFIDAWGSYGNGDGQFAYPSSIAYDKARDRFIIADTKNNRLQIVRLPNSSSGPQNVLRGVMASPWRYILIPIVAVLLLSAAVYGVRKAYLWRERKNEERDDGQ